MAKIESSNSFKTASNNISLPQLHPKSQDVSGAGVFLVTVWQESFIRAYSNKVSRC
jgi:hypothetical protein